MGVGSGGGLVAVGVSVGGGVFDGVSVGPAVGEAVAVAVFVAVARGVGELVEVDTIGGRSVLVGEGGNVAVTKEVASPAGVVSSIPAAWLTSSGRSTSVPNAENRRTTRKRSPTQPMPSI